MLRAARHRGICVAKFPNSEGAKCGCRYPGGARDVPRRDRERHHVAIIHGPECAAPRACVPGRLTAVRLTSIPKEWEIPTFCGGRYCVEEGLRLPALKFVFPPIHERNT